MQLTHEHIAKVAQALVDVDAIKVSTQQPFIYTSGWASPVYLDICQLMSVPIQRSEVMHTTMQFLAGIISDSGINAIVGAESSGIAFAAWIADRANLPMLYLRKRPIGWGVDAQIEGKLPQNPKILLVDDVTTDGRSKVGAALALRKARATIHDIFVLVNFDIYQHTTKKFEENHLKLHALITWPKLYQVLASTAQLPPLQKKSIEDFNDSPITWSLKHGGVGA